MNTLQETLSSTTALEQGATGWFEVTVSRVEWVADEVVSLTLHPRHGDTLPEWNPGAHIDVELGPGLVRQYSLCGDPGDRASWRIAVLREHDGRGGSMRASTMRPGEHLPVRGPRNHFPLHSAHGYLFIAGGIGITPLLPMVHTVARTATPWRLFYGGRSRSSMAFTDELARYGERVRLCPEDEFGLLDMDALLSASQPNSLAYCCGPDGMLTAVTEHAAHWPHGSVRVEHFTAANADAASPGNDLPFELECRVSNVTVTVASNESIIDAVERTGGVVVASSCREGVCGTCETTVLEGVPDHRDSVLSNEEREDGDVMMTCVSRARTQRLVLDM